MGSHHFRFSRLKPQEVSEGGYRIRATKSNFAALQNMSIYKLILKVKAVREPHWHANADELGYCLHGKVLVSFYANQNLKESFLVEEGDVFLIPSGALHSIENVGEKTAELLLQFSHEEPEDFGLSSVFGMFSNAVLGNTWGMPSAHFQKMKRLKEPTFIAKLAASTDVTKEALYQSPYRFALQKSSAPIQNRAGDAKVARRNVWPVLRRQALYALRLTSKGMREPHWHPETAELGYVREGKGRMSILSASGKVDTYQMEAGDIYFIPKAYPHHIENLGKSDLQMLIFFDQAMPEDIGFTGSVKSYSDDVLAAIQQSPKELFAKLPTYYEDLFIVNKRNS